MHSGFRARKPRGSQALGYSGARIGDALAEASDLAWVDAFPMLQAIGGVDGLFCKHAWKLLLCQGCLSAGFWLMMASAQTVPGNNVRVKSWQDQHPLTCWTGALQR